MSFSHTVQEDRKFKHSNHDSSNKLHFRDTHTCTQQWWYQNHLQAMISPACCRKLIAFSELDFSPGLTNVLRLILAVVLRLIWDHNPGKLIKYNPNTV